MNSAPNLEEHYVYQDGEVKLTGRIAVRAVGNKKQELVEITPASVDDGSWKRWVPLSSLFKVMENASPSNSNSLLSLK